MKLTHPAKLLGTWFGVGLVPKASGTAGSLAALPFAWAIQNYAGNTMLLLAALIIFVVGCRVSHVYVTQTGKQDPREIVIDEVAGIWLLLAALPPTLPAYIAGFILFRFFDVLKPWPVSWLDEHVKGGLGVMLDDIAAAFYPIIIMLLTVMLAPAFGKEVTFDDFYDLLENHVSE